MKWFEWINLTGKFQELLKNWWDKQKAKELISQEVDIRVKDLENAWVKIDPIEWELFIKKFKEARIAEFEKLLLIKEQWWKLSNEVEMNYKWLKWTLKLWSPEMMDNFFERLVKKQKMERPDILND